MRILVTGGTGLIGRRLCAVLLQQGHSVIVLSRQAHSRVRQLCGRVTVWNALDQWPQVPAIDAVINLAGEPIVDRRWSPAQKQRLLDSRIALTQQLVDRMRQSARPPSVLLSGSAIGWYGDRAIPALDESIPAATDFAARLCRDWEQAALQATAFGTRVCLLRTGLVLDARGGLLSQLLPTARLGLGAVLGSGSQWMSWIHIEDHVRALLHLLADTRAAGPFNLTAPEPVSQRQFAQTLAQTLKRPALLRVPAWPLRMLLGERASLVLGGQHVLPRALLDHGFRFRHTQLQTALADLLLPSGV